MDTNGERFIGRDGQARITQAVADRVLAKVQGLPASQALWALRFVPSIVCPQVARVIQLAVAEAARRGDLSADDLVVAESTVGEGENMIRVRRQAHGIAGWITTLTTAISVELRPAQHAAFNAAGVQHRMRESLA